MATGIFIIKKGENMYVIFVNLWKLLAKFDWRDEGRRKIFKDFRSRLPEVNIYYDAVDLAKEFTEKIGYKLVKEE